MIVNEAFINLIINYFTLNSITAKIYPVIAPNTASFPCLVLRRTSNSSNYMDGTLDTATFECTVISPSISEAWEISDALNKYVSTFCPADIGGEDEPEMIVGMAYLDSREDFTENGGSNDGLYGVQNTYQLVYKLV